MLKKVILCPNPYRDHELTVAKEAKRILDSVHCPNVVCVPFRNCLLYTSPSPRDA